MEHASWKALRTAHHRYLIQAEGRESLWDLMADPQEYHDVAAAASYQSVLATHRRLLLQKLLAAERPLPRRWAY